MDKKFLLIIFLIYFFNYPIICNEIRGIGIGKTQEEAKNKALNDLASLIKIEVKSKFLTITQEENGAVYEFAKQFIETEVDIPILGAEFIFESNKEGYKAIAFINTEKSLPLYEKQLIDLKDKIETNYNNISKIPQKDRYYYLSELLTLFAQFDKYKSAAILLNSSKIPTLNITELEVKNMLRNIANNIQSLDIGAEYITKDIDKNKIYVYPAAVSGSHEITQFASVLKDKITQKLNTVSSPDKADYFFVGKYEILNDGIEVTYRLLNKNSDILKTNIIKLAKEAYSSYVYEPQNMSFDKLLYQGLVVSSDFNVAINTNRGSKDLLFKNGEELEILIKMNKPGYFYIVNHVRNSEQGEYSYLLELNPDASHNRKFIYYVNPDNVNKWISIGKFQVSPPFGVENLQVIASNKDLIDNIPSYKYDNETELFIIGEPSNAVVKTRAIKPVKTKETLSAEAVLTYTTINR